MFASVKVDISSKVQLSEDLRRAIADSKQKPTKPKRDLMPYVACGAAVVCHAIGILNDTPALSSAPVKIFIAVYLVLLLIVQEVTLRKQTSDFR